MAQLPRFFEAGQDFGEHDVPDQQLQVDRHVAEELHVAVADLAGQEVAGEAAHADQGADAERDRGGDYSNQQRHARAPDDSRSDIAPEAIGPKRIGRALALALQPPIDLRVVDQRSNKYLWIWLQLSCNN